MRLKDAPVVPGITRIERPRLNAGNKNLLTKLAAFCIALTLITVVVSCQQQPGASLRVGEEAPAFKLKNLNGQTVSLSDFDGKVVMIEFWATWCPPCRESAPEMEALYQRFKDRSFVLLSISIDEGGDAVEKVRAFANEYNLSYPILMDNGNASRTYAVSSIPVMYLLDKKLRIVRKYPGYVPGLGEEIADQIEILKMAKVDK